jgi:hypothetical protein
VQKRWPNYILYELFMTNYTGFLNEMNCNY